MYNKGLRMERMKGIEPSYSAWEADVLPLNYIRMKNHELSISANRRFVKKQPAFAAWILKKYPKNKTAFPPQRPNYTSARLLYLLFHAYKIPDLLILLPYTAVF